MTETVKSRWPTQKWWVTQITAVSAWLVALIQNDLVVSTPLAILAVGIVSQALIGYIVPNAGTPGGIPRKRR